MILSRAIPRPEPDEHSILICLALTIFIFIFPPGIQNLCGQSRGIKILLRADLTLVKFIFQWTKNDKLRIKNNGRVTQSSISFSSKK